MDSQDGPALTGRILVVDDQENMCWLLRRLLSERGHHVATAQSGGAALRLVERQEYQVAVVDYRLPDTTGLELIARIRLRRPGLTAILMTSYGTPALKDHLAAARLFAFFDKPFKNALMVCAVEDALAAGAPAAVSRSLVVGDIARTPAPAAPKTRP